MLKKFSMIVSVVALLTLALVGCKNGMLGEDDATVNGIRDMTEVRTAHVTVTNYAGTGASRSAAGGSLRTIAPTTPTVTAGYTFIVEGKSGRNTLQPKVVTIDPQGRVDLSDLAPGLWSITLTAYDDNLLGGTADAPGIILKKDTAAVLSGSATVDLTRSSGDVLITLTPRNIGTEGNVALEVTFDTNDKNKIQNRDPNYEVTIGLYEKSSGKAVLTTGGQSTVKDVKGQMGLAAVQYDVNKVPVGEYIFKVIITNTTDPTQGPWYWSDNIFIHGNMITNGNVTVDELLGGAAPTEPADFVVYWANNATKTKPDGTEYTAHFAWTRKSFNEAGFELQIADITDDFTPGNNQYNMQPVNNGATLWAQIEGNPDKYTVIKYTDFARVDYPIYDKVGSLIAGNSYVDYALPSGRLYTARIRATNFGGHSGWVYLQAGGNEPNSKWQDIGHNDPNLNVTGAERLSDNYYFDVFSVTYRLGNFILLKGTEAVTNAVNGDVEYAKFAQVGGYTIKYPVAQNIGEPAKYQLYKSTFLGPANFDSPERIKSWSGWNNATDRMDPKVYGERENYLGHTNVTLTPAGASGGLSVDVITAGTFKDLLEEDKVFIQLKEGANQTAALGGIVWGTANRWDNIRTNIKTQGSGSQVGTVDAKKGISIPDAIQPTVKDFLCVGVGKDETNLGKLTVTTAQHPAGRDTTVYQMQLTLEQNGTVIASGVSSPGESYVVADVTTLAEGDYTLRLYVIPMEGYGFSFQRPFVVKCSGTTIQ